MGMWSVKGKSSCLLLDLTQDLENTTGAWDMYGQEEARRYPGIQEEFFYKATDALSRRESLNAFVALGAFAVCLLFLCFA
jgi:photosystem I subunit 6